MTKNIIVYCLGVCTMDIMSKMERFPSINSKNKSSDLKMCGGGNAANVAFDLFKMVHNNMVVVSDHEEGIMTIKLISKIGDDVIGQSILKEFNQLESNDLCKFDTSGIVVSSGCKSSFSYILVTPSDNSKDAFDRTIINTPLSEGFKFEELKQDENSLIDLLFLDGRYADLAIQYIEKNSCKCIVMECERMRFGSELRYFLHLISKSNIITLSEGFGNEYFEYFIKEIANSGEKEWIEELVIQGFDTNLLALHLIFSLLEESGNSCFPNFILQTLGSKGSICMVKFQTEQGKYNQVKSLSEIVPEETIGISPHTLLFSYTVNHSRMKHTYIIIYCQAYSNITELPILDSTGAGDAFNSATLYTLQRFMKMKVHFDTTCLEKLLKFSSISAVYCCSAVGARTRIIDSTVARTVWNEL